MCKIGCKRAGIKRRRLKVKNARKGHFKKAKSKILGRLKKEEKLLWIAEKRKPGSNISADAKQMICNVFNYFHHDEDLPKAEVNLKC